MKKEIEQSGADLIAAERERQISKEGWTPEHDDSHITGDMIDAASCYATVASSQVRGGSAEEWPVHLFNGHCDSLLQWPWEDAAWKPSDDPIRNLVKAGALIAAEIDRLNRLKIPEGIMGMSGLIPLQSSAGDKTIAKHLAAKGGSATD